MKNFTQKFIGLFTLAFAMSFTVYADDVCIDPLANNYFAYADPASPTYLGEEQLISMGLTVNNDACTYAYGCTDPTAFNYDSTAEVDDGSCEPYIVGCMDESYMEYNVLANTSNSSYCLTLIVEGCTFPEPYIDNTGVNMTIVLTPGVINQFPSNIINDSYIIAHGETNGIYVGSWFMNDVQNGTLAFPVWGDDAATSEINGLVAGESINFQLVNDTNLYDLDLTFAGTNAYMSNSILPAISVSYSLNCSVTHTPGCTEESASNYNPSATTDDGSCIAVVVGCTDQSAWNFDPIANYDNGTCIVHELGFNPDWNDDPFNITSWSEWCEYEVNYNPGIIICANPYILNNCDLICGCIDSTAFNYDTDATTDDGSCIFDVLGCTDENAFNYNFNANIDDGSCYPIIYGCLDTNAFNYNSEANTPEVIVDFSGFHEGVQGRI